MVRCAALAMDGAAPAAPTAVPIQPQRKLPFQLQLHQSQPTAHVAVATLATQSVQGGRFVALSMDFVGAAALTAALIKPVFSLENRRQHGCKIGCY